MTFNRVLVAGVLAFSIGSAQAALNDRGGGLLYDDVLHITWLQDANYAKTRGYDADGAMNWSAANTWADNLVFHDSVRNVDYSDWRLPTVSPVDGSSQFNWDVRTDGTSDRGYNITSPASELSYMYYVNLNLKGLYAESGAFQPDSGLFGNGIFVGQNDVGLVKNFQSDAYWFGTSYAVYDYYYWYFGIDGAGYHVGYQNGAPYFNEFYAWAVRPGDVAAVPEPETYAMLLAGLVMVGLASRRRNNQR